MAKTASRRLYELIHRLSASEKRYFRMYVAREAGGATEEPKYLRLFRLIEAQDSFDDETLVRELYPDLQQQDKKFSELKAYLYKLIVATLRNYDERSSVEYRLKNSLLDLRTLFRRGLYDHCRTLLRKTEKTARRYERFTAQLELLDWQRRLFYAQRTLLKHQAALKDINEREAALLRDRDLKNRQRNLFYETLLHLRRDVLHATEEEDFLRELPRHPLLREEPPTTGFWAQVYRLKTWSFYHYALKQYPKFYEKGKQLLDLFERHRHFIVEEPGEYVAVINNHIVACGHLNRFEEIAEVIEKIPDYQQITIYEKQQAFRTYYNTKLRLLIQRGEFGQGLKLIDRQRRELERENLPEIRQSGFYFRYFYIYFGTGDYDNALEYLNRWLDLPRSEGRRDLQSIARILQLLVHYERENWVLLESLLRSTERFHAKQQQVMTLERSITATIRTAYQLPDPRSRGPVFQKLLDEIARVREQPAERALLGLFDLESWARSQLTRRDFGEVVREKFTRSVAADDGPSGDL